MKGIEARKKQSINNEFEILAPLSRAQKNNK